MILINKSIDVLYRSQEKYSNIECDRVATSLTCFLFVVCLFVCLFCCFCFVCVSHDEVSKPRSMQLIDCDVINS